MDESRDRFDEAAPHDPRRAWRPASSRATGRTSRSRARRSGPRPRARSRDRTYCVAMSPDSVLAAADLGARMVMFSQRPWADQAASVAHLPRAVRRRARPRARTAGRVRLRVLRRGRRPRRGGRRTSTSPGTSPASWSTTSSRATTSSRPRATSPTAAPSTCSRRSASTSCARCTSASTCGARPTRSSSACDARREVIGDHDLTCCFRYAGLPYEEAEASMRLFAAEVLPIVQAEPVLR